VESRLTTTFELRDGKTLLTLVQSDFETEEERDANLSGAAPFLDSLQRVVSRRAAS
jgi:hypothetical protein